LVVAPHFERDLVVGVVFGFDEDLPTMAHDAYQSDHDEPGN
jgi:hypothetical protein